eukprot:9483793-Pyramimonas_sp.AAC.1
MGEQAVGDQCEECFELHRDAFPYLSWSELCEANGKEGDVKTLVSKARAVKHGQAQPPNPKQELVKIGGEGFEVRSSFM